MGLPLASVRLRCAEPGSDDDIILPPLAYFTGTIGTSTQPQTPIKSASRTEEFGEPAASQPQVATITKARRQSISSNYSKTETSVNIQLRSPSTETPLFSPPPQQHISMEGYLSVKWKPTSPVPTLVFKSASPSLSQTSSASPSSPRSLSFYPTPPLLTSANPVHYYCCSASSPPALYDHPFSLPDACALRGRDGDRCRVWSPKSWRLKKAGELQLGAKGCRKGKGQRAAGKDGDQGAERGREGKMVKRYVNQGC